jgi:hypothetical protein
MTTRRERAKEPAAKLNKQLAEIEEAGKKEMLRAEKRKNINRWASNLFTDMAKLVFAGVIVGGVFEKVEEPLILYGIGFVVLLGFLCVGYIFVKKI